MNSKDSLDDSFQSEGSIDENVHTYLTENCIKNLIDKTHFTRDQIKVFHSSFLKDFPRGKLNKTQFFQIYKKCEKENNPNAFCEHIFRAFDSDNDGSIGFSEFLIGVSMPSAPLNKKSLRNKLRWLFNIYDINGDGLVDKAEVQTVIDSFYTLLGDEEEFMTLKVQAVVHANEIFDKLNFDKKMFITIDQFTEGCLEDYKLLNLFAPIHARKLNTKS